MAIHVGCGHSAADRPCDDRADMHWTSRPTSFTFLAVKGGLRKPSSPPTAIALILLATALFSFTTPRPTLAAWLVSCAGLIAITALLAFLFGATPLYQLPDAPITGEPMPGRALKFLPGLRSLFTKGVALPTAVIGFS